MNDEIGGLPATLCLTVSDVFKLTFSQIYFKGKQDHTKNDTHTIYFCFG